MKRPEKVIESVWLALNKGGRFVVEFGGKGNIGIIYQAFVEVLLTMESMQRIEILGTFLALLNIVHSLRIRDFG